MAMIYLRVIFGIRLKALQFFNQNADLHIKKGDVSLLERRRWRG